MKNLIISCEHAVNTLPDAYQFIFSSNPSVLDTHRAIDFGAFAIAKHFKQAFNCPLISASISRLIIDCNRSLTHPDCFSTFTKKLPLVEKQGFIETYYKPYRQEVEALINAKIAEGLQVIHLSIHSFTPKLKNIERNADIGLLYDPTRLGEKTLAYKWRKGILKKNNEYRVRMNYPYRGISDGFITSLRKQHDEKHYLGFEVESNQALVNEMTTLQSLSETLVDSFRSIVQSD